MKEEIYVGLLFVLLAPSMAVAQQQPSFGTEEFGLSPRELVQAIERSEELISRCMREQGFEYVAADYNTVRQGMSADKKIPGLSEQQFIERYGFGVSTFYTGIPPQLSKDYSPARVGLGERNVEIFRALSPEGQVAYNRALLGESVSTPLAVALEIENLSQTGGCTRQALEQVFRPDQLKASYYNPQDALINKDQRMKSALADWRRQMKNFGFDYAHPDDIEPDLRNQLNALTDGGKLLVANMSPDQKAALHKLQDFERAVAVRSFKLKEEILEPVEERIQQELFSRKVQ